jgi:hypothetical protein
LDSRDNILIQKLDEFIRKFYKNKLLKGSIYESCILLSAFLTVVLVEYFGEFNTIVRAILSFGFLIATLSVSIFYIGIPLLKLNKIGKIISYQQAAGIIGSHFSNVQDKLLNVLQLQNNLAANGSAELLLAGIHQKIKELQPVVFTRAVDLNENRKYLFYILPLVFLTAGIFVIWPGYLKEYRAFGKLSKLL